MPLKYPLLVTCVLAVSASVALAASTDSKPAPMAPGPSATTAQPSAQADMQQSMMAMQRQMDDMFRNFFDRGGTSLQQAAVPAPAVDEVNGDKSFTVRAEMPGMSLADIDASVTGHTLDIKGTKEKEKKLATGTYQSHEISYGSFERQIDLPADTDPAKAVAVYKDGVLTVTVPKVANAAPAETKKLTITQ
jgi:HSP20 family protein